MTFQGLDPERVEQTADTLEGQASALDSVASHVDGLIRTAMHHWSGPEAQDFHQWWVGQHRPRLVSAAQGLHGAAAGVRRQVAEQEQASGQVGGHATVPQMPIPSSLAQGFAGAVGAVGVGLGLVESAFHTTMGVLKHEGPIGAISAWDVVTNGFKVADLAGHKVPFVSDAFLATDTLDVIDRTVRGEASIGDWFHEAGDWTTKAGEVTHIPVIGLIGLNINVWTMVGEEAGKADWSPSAMSDTATYAFTHPADVVDVLADSTLEVGKKLISWL